MENRHGLVVGTRRTPATGTAEREAAIALLDSRPTTRGITLGGDKNDDTHQFVQDLWAVRGTLHAETMSKIRPLTDTPSRSNLDSCCE